MLKNEVYIRASEKNKSGPHQQNSTHVLQEPLSGPI